MKYLKPDINFINENRVQKGDDLNFILMTGGYLNIKNKSTFVNWFMNNFTKFSLKHNAGGIVFKVPREKPLPIICDIDVDLSREVTLKEEVFVELSEMIIDEFTKITGVTEPVEIVMTRRPEACYYKKVKKVWHAGFHLYILGRYTLQQSVQLRENVLKNINVKGFFTNIWGDSVLNSAEKIFDPALSKRSNGVLLIGCRKPNLKVAPHFIFFRGLWRNAWLTHKILGPGWHVEHLESFKELFERIYGFIWEKFTPTRKQDFTMGLKSATQPTHVSLPQQEFCNFNLKAFLEATKDKVPDNSKWKQLCVYFASQKLNPHTTNELCWKYWGHACKPEQRYETKKFMKSVTRFDVGKGSVVDYLANYGNNWEDHEIFGEDTRCLGYDTFLEMFDPKKKDAHLLAEVQAALKRTVSYVKELDQFTHLMEREVRDPSGNMTTLTHREFSKHAAFAGNDGFKVKIFPSKEELVKTLLRMVPKNPKSKEAFDLEDSVKKCIVAVEAAKNDKVAFGLAQSQFGAKIKYVKKPTHTILADLHDDVELKRYSTLVFLPYIGTLAAYIGKNELNTFDGFPLDGCPPSQVDIKSTLIWEYLYSVWGWNGENMRQLEFLLDLVAFKLQYPAIRTERIMLLISEKQGTGKSFFFEILTMVFGARYCNFHDSLDKFITRFNITDAAKIHIWLDDIETATRAQTQKLFPKVTCKQQEYEKKNETKFTLKEYSEIWITANAEPLYSTPEERRQLFFMASDYKLQDRAFFKRVYRETKLLSHSRAFFHFFKNRDVSKFSPADNPCPEIKGQAVVKCMAKPIIFVKDFFCTEEWYRLHKKPYVRNNIWVRELEVRREKDKIKLRISKKRLYYHFQCYMKEFYSGSRCQDLDTFYRSLEKVGIVPGEKRLMIGGPKGVKRFCVDLEFTGFEWVMRKLYNGIQIQTWCHVENLAQFVKNLKNYSDDDDLC